jgi:hypothetical protein
MWGLSDSVVQKSATPWLLELPHKLQKSLELGGINVL